MSSQISYFDAWAEAHEAPAIDTAIARFFAFIDAGDLCSLLLPTLLLLYVGNHVVARYPVCRAWGQRFAWIALVGWISVKFSIDLPSDGSELLAAIIRALLAAGLVLGTMWILLPAFAQLRFIAASVIHWLDESIVRPLTNVLLWFPRLIWSWQKKHAAAARQRASITLTDKDRETQRQRDAAQQEQWRQQQTVQHRCAQARLACQMLYDRHAAIVASGFPRKRFDAYLLTYLSDKEDAAVVEERADQLKRMIAELAAAVSPTHKSFSSLGALIAAFEGRRSEVASLPLDDETKQTLNNLIARQEDEALRQFLKP